MSAAHTDQVSTVALTVCLSAHRYSSDFFDGKHQVVLGASYATIPRLGDRRTVRNFYQRNYPYAWVGARVAFDA